ncbi:MAG: MATE family efflux transporter [Ignavibacteriae bacterium]|nr:MATE family efflux transporter [Ignavibacteriota bacterium]
MKIFKENNLGKNSIKYHLIDTIKLAIPVSIGQLGHVMLGVVDSFMVGRLGAEPLAAAALANGLFFFVMVLGIGMSHAITVLVAIAKGENNNAFCGRILRHSLIVNIIFSVILTVLVMIFQTYRQFVEGLSHTKPPMYIAIISNFVNFFGNWVLIYGNLGFPTLGLNGAGYATLSTRTFMAIAMMFFVLKKPIYKEYEPNLKFRAFDFSIIKKILSIGFPSGIMYAFEVGAFAFAAVIIGWLGSVSLAAHQIAINLATISYMVVLGISAAATIRVGNALGRKNYINLKKAGFTAILLGMSFMGLSGLIFILFHNILPTYYINDQKVIAAASTLIIIAAFFQLSDGVQAVGMGVLKGIADVKIPMIITLVSYWVIGLPSGYFFAFILNYDIIGIWIGLSLGLTAAAVLFVWRFYRKLKLLS